METEYFILVCSGLCGCTLVDIEEHAKGEATQPECPNPMNTVPNQLLKRYPFMVTKQKALWKPSYSPVVPWHKESFQQDAAILRQGLQWLRGLRCCASI